jgi:hypothetical protein
MGPQRIAESGKRATDGILFQIAHAARITSGEFPVNSRQAARLLHLFTRQTEALDRRRAATGDRAERGAREAYFREKEERQEEERLYRVGLGPKPRRRPKRPGGRGNGASGERIDLPDGLYIPDPLSG